MLDLLYFILVYVLTSYLFKVAAKNNPHVKSQLENNDTPDIEKLPVFTVEEYNNTFLVYNNNNFMAQGNNMEDAIENLKKYKKVESAVIVSGNRKIIMVNNQYFYF